MFERGSTHWRDLTSWGAFDKSGNTSARHGVRMAVCFKGSGNDLAQQKLIRKTEGPCACSFSPCVEMAPSTCTFAKKLQGRPHSYMQTLGSGLQLQLTEVHDSYVAARHGKGRTRHELGQPGNSFAL